MYLYTGWYMRYDIVIVRNTESVWHKRIVFRSVCSVSSAWLAEGVQKRVLHGEGGVPNQVKGCDRSHGAAKRMPCDEYVKTGVSIYG
jgi:hypothetical protein